MSSAAVNSCLNILRRTPVTDIEQNLSALGALVSKEEDVEDLFQRVDCPLKTAVDPDAGGKKYLMSDHNRDGESHRSPWSNRYYPPIPKTNDEDEEGGGSFYPSRTLRHVEIIANEVFESYCHAYYGNSSGNDGDGTTGTVSSVYLWDKEQMDDNEVGTDTGVSSGRGGGMEKVGFAGCFLVSKRIETDDRREGGFWNSTHVVNVLPNSEGGRGTTKYELTSTLLLMMRVGSSSSAGDGDGDDGLRIAGTLTKRTEKTFRTDVPKRDDDGEGAVQHVLNVGRMIEGVESDMRSSMESLYVGKTKEVVDSIRRDERDVARCGAMAAMMAARRKE